MKITNFIFYLFIIATKLQMKTSLPSEQIGLKHLLPPTMAINKTRSMMCEYKKECQNSTPLEQLKDFVVTFSQSKSYCFHNFNELIEFQMLLKGT